ncbi:MAG: tetratricopeptide repeat protein [Candidatus Obscuribacterales bacterium]|nr:tetratricopeptide repeat protein [Candidatus Obscuribacterales bacterium]
MQGFSDSKSQVKKLGELLLDAGFVSKGDLERAVEISRKNFQSLGKVLVSLKVCREPDVNSALEVQKVCKLDGLSPGLAVRALTQIRVENCSVAHALETIGWLNKDYKPYDEPANVVAAKNELKALGAEGGIAYGLALEKVADAYAENKLPARAEVRFEEAVAVYEKLLPESALALSGVLSKMGRLSFQQRRHEEARSFLERAQACLEGTGNKASKEYVKVLHATAEYSVVKKKFADAEQQYRDSFNTLAPLCGLEDQQVIETIRRYVDAMGKAKREPDQATLGELLKGARILSDEALTNAWQYSKKSRMPLGRALVALDCVSEHQLQVALQMQTMVKNGEITTQLAIWIMLYVNSLKKTVDQVLEIFGCQPKSRNIMADELKLATAVLAELESRLPPNHSELAFAHGKIARIYFTRQQWLESDEHYKRAVEIVSANPNVAIDKAIELVDQYCELKEAQEDFDELVRLGKASVQLRAKEHGQISLPYAKGVEKLALIFCRRGDHGTALGCFDRALLVREKMYGTEDKELLSCLESRAECYSHVQDYANAESSYERALNIADRSLGRGHDTSQRLLKKLVQILKDVGNYEKAKSLSPGRLKNQQAFI